MATPFPLEVKASLYNSLLGFTNLLDEQLSLGELEQEQPYSLASQ